MNYISKIDITFNRATILLFVATISLVEKIIGIIKQ